MQDWDFPHFTNTLDVNLPGFYKHMVTFQAVEIQISGINYFDSSLLPIINFIWINTSWNMFLLSTLYYFIFRKMVQLWSYIFGANLGSKYVEESNIFSTDKLWTIHG